MDEQVLATVLTEVEAILNSRPLCAASDDPDDQEPLTPNHLLLQKAVHNLPPGSFVKEDLFLRKKWRQAQILADHFWKRWLKEMVEGDLVLLVDDCLPRSQWRMGLVKAVYPSKDGLVRSVEVKTGASSSLVRQIQKLCLLEESFSLKYKEL